MFILMKEEVENPGSDPQLADAIPLLAKVLPPNETEDCEWLPFLQPLRNLKHHPVDLAVRTNRVTQIFARMTRLRRV